jgi:hypothetical protein
MGLSPLDRTGVLSMDGMNSKKAERAKGETGARPAFATRIVKWVGIGLLALAGLVAVLILLLMMAPVRSAILGYAIPRLATRLPGELAVSEATWPGLGTVELSGIKWANNDTTAFSADTVSVSVRVLPLLRRDIKAGQVIAHGVFADVPRLKTLLSHFRAFAEQKKEESETGGEEGRPGFPRQGSVPGFPSVAVDSISVTAPLLLIAPDSRIEKVVFNGGSDFSVGSRPRAHTSRLEFKDGAGDWRVDDFSLSADLEKGMLEAKGSGVLGDLPLALEIKPLGPDEFRLQISSSRYEAPPDGPGVVASVALKRDGLDISSLDYDLSLRTPDTEQLMAIRALAGRLKGLPASEGITMKAQGSVTLKPGLAVKADFVLREPARLKRGMIAVRYENETAIVDSLSLALPEGIVVSTSGRVKPGQEIVVSLRPVVVRSADDDMQTAGPAGGETATIVYSPKTREVSIDGFTVAGDYGTLTVDGDLTGLDSGCLDLKGRWPEPPRALIRKFAEPRVLADSLAQAWAGDAPYSLDAGMSLSRRDGSRRVEAEISMKLPGPRNMRPLLPGGADVQALGPVRGKLGLNLRLDGALHELDLTGSLAETDWIDKSSIGVTIVGDSVHVDSFALSAGELALSLEGDMDLRTRAGSGSLALRDSGFLRLVWPAMPDMSLLANARSSRRADGVHAEANLDGAVASRAYNIPSIIGVFTMNPHQRTARLRLPHGLSAGHTRLDSLTVAYVALDTASFFPAGVTLNAYGDKLSLGQKSRVDVGTRIVFAVDSLGIRAAGRDLQSAAPFQVALDRQSGGFSVEGLSLKGSLGNISLEGFAGPDSVDIRGKAQVVFPDNPPPALGIPSGLWPRGLDAEFNAPAADQVDFSATVTGFTLDDGTEGVVTVDMAGDGRKVTASIDLTRDSDRLLEGEVTLPAGIRVYPPLLIYHRGNLTLNVKARGFPLALRRAAEEAPGRVAPPPGLIARVDADAGAWGPAREPQAYFNAEVSFPDWPEMSDFRISAEGAMHSDSVASTADSARIVEILDRVMADLGIESSQPLVVHFGMKRAERTLLTGNLSFPAELAFNPPRFDIRINDRMDAAVKSRGLPLEDIDLLLPPDLALDGDLVFDLSGRGPVKNPALAGNMNLPGLEVGIAELARISLEGGLDIKGTARKPIFEGSFTVNRGVINIPSTSRNLYPVEGHSILLDTGWRAGRDSLAGTPSARDTLTALSSPLPFQPEYDVSIEIAPGFRLLGEGLEVELDGKIDVTQKDGLPVIVGDLYARRGTFLFLGRIFQLESGTVSFYGDKQLNPSLDITLTSTIDATKVWIMLGGTLEKPELKFKSDPDMSEGDIMAIILFGKPLDQLSEGQGAMLKERTADVLLTLGAAKLQQALAGQLGIDILSVRSARGEGNEGSALVVGKYLTPDLLVTYEQALQEKSTSYIVMEYALSRLIKLETLYSNQNRAGAGITLEKDY